MIGVFIRFIGYGIMLRLRGATNSTAELIIVQVIQGTGSGIILTILVVVVQVLVPRAELSQSTALQLLIIYMGNALRSTAAGAIYTNSLRERLVFHFPSATTQDVDEVFNTISEVAYPMGSPARLAINRAYSDVMRYRTLAALGASVGGVLIVWRLPDLTLTDKHNLAGALDGEGSPGPARKMASPGQPGGGEQEGSGRALSHTKCRNDIQSFVCNIPKMI